MNLVAARLIDLAPRLGKLGDTVDFALLPAAVQTFDIASAFGAVGERSGGQVEACGSPGEVANQPELGHRYAMQLVSSDINDISLGPLSCPRFASCDDWGVVSASPLLTRYDRDNAKSMVHNTIALRADDQLRQRVAWALAQIYVVGTEGLGKEKQTEVWVNWYDIFVRNAFGNLRDLLFEISYSPMMSSYLTFLGSRSLAASGAPPDENYARELMYACSQELGPGRTACSRRAVFAPALLPQAAVHNRALVDQH